MRSHWFVLPVLLVASLAQDPQLTARHAAKAEPRPAVTFTGAASAVTKAGYQRLRTAQELARAWLLHAGKPAPERDYDFFYNLAAVPEVYFDTFEVIAIFGGETMNSAGFSVAAVLDEPGRRVVRFDHKSYQTAGPDGGGKHVTPFAFLVMPRTALPIVLEENVQSLIGKPPEWKERARL